MGICLHIRYENKSPSQEHDLIIDAVGSFEKVHLYLQNSTDGINNSGYTSVNVIIPSEDIQLDFYCGMPGHRPAGELGTIFVGNSEPDSPSVDQNQDSSATAPNVPAIGLPYLIPGIIILGIVNRAIRKYSDRFHLMFQC